MDPADEAAVAASGHAPLRLSAAHSLLSTPSTSTVVTTSSHGPWPPSHSEQLCGGASSVSAEPAAPLRPTLPSAVDGSTVRHARPYVATAARVTVEPRAHHYKTVVFAPTTLCVSLRVDNMKFARCSDKVIRVPDYRYEDMHGARPAALLSRCAPLLTFDSARLRHEWARTAMSDSPLWVSLQCMC